MRSSENALGPPPEADFARAVDTCRRDEPFLAALREVYRRADGAVAALGLRCRGGGACCKFDLFDHRLFVTPGEVALLTLSPPGSLSRASRRRCPWQSGPSCLAYPLRPLGCRTFFCTASGKRSAEEVGQHYHRQIAQVHEIRCLPCACADVFDVLAQLFSLK